MVDKRPVKNGGKTAINIGNLPQEISDRKLVEWNATHVKTSQEIRLKIGGALIENIQGRSHLQLNTTFGQVKKLKKEREKFCQWWNRWKLCQKAEMKYPNNWHWKSNRHPDRNNYIKRQKTCTMVIQFIFVGINISKVKVFFIQELTSVSMERQTKIGGLVDGMFFSMFLTI